MILVINTSNGPHSLNSSNTHTTASALLVCTNPKAKVLASLPPFAVGGTVATQQLRGTRLSLTVHQCSRDFDINIPYINHISDVYTIYLSLVRKLHRLFFLTYASMKFEPPDMLGSCFPRLIIHRKPVPLCRNRFRLAERCHGPTQSIGSSR